MTPLQRKWERLWLRWGGTGLWGRTASRAAAAFSGPYYARHRLARLHRRGYTAASARLAHRHLQRSEHVFIDDEVLIFEDAGDGEVRLGARVHLHRGSILQTGQGGRIELGEDCAIQARCHFAAYVGPIRLGRGVQVAPNCAFFSYNHGLAAGEDMRRLPLTTRGGISIGEGAWIGAGAIILDGASIGTGAVIAAGAVVGGEVPPRRSPAACRRACSASAHRPPPCHRRARGR